MGGHPSKGIRGSKTPTARGFTKEQLATVEAIVKGGSNRNRAIEQVRKYWDLVVSTSYGGKIGTPKQMANDITWFAAVDNY